MAFHEPIPLMLFMDFFDIFEEILLPFLRATQIS